MGDEFEDTEGTPEEEEASPEAGYPEHIDEYPAAEPESGVEGGYETDEAGAAESSEEDSDEMDEEEIETDPEMLAELQAQFPDLEFE